MMDVQGEEANLKLRCPRKGEVERTERGRGGEGFSILFMRGGGIFSGMTQCATYLHGRDRLHVYPLF